MALRAGTRLAGLRTAISRVTSPAVIRGLRTTPVNQGEYYLHIPRLNRELIVRAASTPPFAEQTSANMAATFYAEASEALHTYGSYLTQCMPKHIQQFSVLKDELTLYIPPSAVIPVLTFLRDHSQCQFKSLVDISGADYPERTKRFEVVYHLLSVSPSQAGRIRVKTYASEVDFVPSATSVFRGADWWANWLIQLLPTHPCAGMRGRHGTCLASFSRVIPICK